MTGSSHCPDETGNQVSTFAPSSAPHVDMSAKGARPPQMQNSGPLQRRRDRYAHGRPAPFNCVNNQTTAKGRSASRGSTGDAIL